MKFLSKETQQPEPISYPALYTFRVIGKRATVVRDHVRRLVQSVIGVIEDDSVTERPSSGDKYVAIHVTCLLKSEEQRRAIYGRLHADAKAILVL